MMLIAFLAQTLRIAIPYLFASAGGVMSERAGLIGLTLEGCGSCHEPHGSANRHLLLYQQVAQLCYQCHAVTPASHVQPSYRDCTRCHTAIHGSNSQAFFLEP